MPVRILKKNGFQVRTPGGVKAKGTTRVKAEAQRRLLRGADRGNPGRGLRGAGGGIRRRDGSGGGVGNFGTPRQPEARPGPLQRIMKKHIRS